MSLVWLFGFMGTCRSTGLWLLLSFLLLTTRICEVVYGYLMCVFHESLWLFEGVFGVFGGFE
jgi:hypothetical protein